MDVFLLHFNNTFWSRSPRLLQQPQSVFKGKLNSFLYFLLSRIWYLHFITVNTFVYFLLSKIWYLPNWGLENWIFEFVPDSRGVCSLLMSSGRWGFPLKLNDMGCSSSLSRAHLGRWTNHTSRKVPMTINVKMMLHMALHREKH